MKKLPSTTSKSPKVKKQVRESANGVQVTLAYVVDTSPRLSCYKKMKGGIKGDLEWVHKMQGRNSVAEGIKAVASEKHVPPGMMFGYLKPPGIIVINDVKGAKEFVKAYKENTGNVGLDFRKFIYELDFRPHSQRYVARRYLENGKYVDFELGAEEIKVTIDDPTLLLIRDPKYGNWLDFDTKNLPKSMVSARKAKNRSVKEKK